MNTRFHGKNLHIRNVAGPALGRPDIRGRNDHSPEPQYRGSDHQ